MKDFVHISLAFAMLAALLGAGCKAVPVPSKPPRPVKVETVELNAAAGGLRYSATIQPQTQVTLAFKISGYIEQLLQRRGLDGTWRDIQQGDVVRRGVVLARLRENDHRERVNQAQAQGAEAAASLEKARQDAARAERLYAAQSLTRPEYDAARTNLEMARARFAAAAAQTEAAEIVLRDSSLVAPLDAVVLSRQVESGTLASPGIPAFVLADVSRVKAVFGVPDRVVAALAPGAALTVRTDTAAFTGRVSTVSPSADGASRVFNIEVTIANREGALKPGMVVTVLVDEQAPASVPSVPLSAVVKSSTGGYAAFVVEGDGEKTAARLQQVTLGDISGNRILVRGGLAAGQSLIVSGASLVTDGEPVRIIP